MATVQCIPSHLPDANQGQLAVLASTSQHLRSIRSNCGCSSQKEMLAGEDIGRCPSCSLFIQVIYEQVKHSAAAFERCVLAAWSVVSMPYFKLWR